jgi:DNA-binding NtrC family response regulator
MDLRKTTTDYSGTWRGARVLLVDDDAPFRASLAAVLGSEFDVHEAANAALAIETLDRGTFDVIVSDQGMPGASGTSLFEVIQRRYPNLPLILVTGDSRNPEVRKANQTGRILVLYKPFDPQELITWIRSAIVMGKLTRSR